ncbi:MAG: hypothetical protein C4327_11885 [Meiothermus sp.]
MLVARYRPADAIRWIEIGTRRTAKPGDLPFEPPGGARDAILDALQKALDFGRTKMAEFHGQAIRAKEYLLYEDRFEVVASSGTRSVLYADVESLELKRGGSFLFRLRQGRIAVRPYAWLLVLGTRIPLGWERNGVDVPFETLSEEIALRAKVQKVTTHPGR